MAQLSQLSLPSNRQLKDREVGLSLPSNHQLKDREVSKEEATCGNGIPQEYFVDRRIPSVVTIFRYPNFLKDSKSEKVYVPQAVSLGPYHSSRANLSGMKDHKMRALCRMMTRFNNINHGNCPHDRELYYNSAIGKISEHEEAVWNNYEEKFADKSCDLVLDGCFLLEILRTLGGDQLNWEGRDYYEPIFDQRKIEFTGFDILNDILMLENQIPLVVLQKLLQLEFDSVDTADNFLFEVLVKYPGTKFYPFDYDMENWSWPQPVEQVLHFLGLLYRLIVSPPPNDGNEQPDEQVHHCLGLLYRLIVSSRFIEGASLPSGASLSSSVSLVSSRFRRSGACLPSSVSLVSSPFIAGASLLSGASLPSSVSPPSNDGDERAIRIYGKQKSRKHDRCISCAVELSNAGIKFEPINGGIEKIEFDRRKATIYLPPINVTDHTEVLFRNLIALELCQASGHNYVTAYLSLMDNLIDTNEDVAVLKKSKIVNNYLGSEAEVAKLFNGLCKGVCLPPEDVFEELHNNVTNYYNDNFKVWFAQFIKDYVSSPWKFLALLGAILALVLTLLQTIYSILAYYK